MGRPCTLRKVSHFASVHLLLNLWGLSHPHCRLLLRCLIEHGIELELGLVHEATRLGLDRLRAKVAIAASMLHILIAHALAAPRLHIVASYRVDFGDTRARDNELSRRTCLTPYCCLVNATLNLVIAEDWFQSALEVRDMT